jgi:hypothetical protein
VAIILAAIAMAADDQTTEETTVTGIATLIDGT